MNSDKIPLDQIRVANEYEGKPGPPPNLEPAPPFPSP